MSASITANTAAAASARRRPVLATEKRSNTIELVSNYGVSDAVGDVSNSTDKGKSDAILERSSKGPLQLKRTSAVAATAVPVRRPGKSARSVSKAEMPQWLAIASLFAMAFALFVVVFRLVQMVGRLAEGESGSLTGLSDFEGRIADAESLNARMVQVQLEVIDKKKLQSGVGGLRKEINENIDERTANLELEAKSGGLEKSMSELQLKVGDLFSKEELDKFYEELVKKGKNEGGSDLSLDDIQLFAREVVMKEIEKHAADELARVGCLCPW